MARDRSDRGEERALSDHGPAPAGELDHLTDAQVVARSLEDPHAFATVFERHHEAIYRFAWTRAGGAHADDLAAEVFRVAFERRASYDLDYPSAKPWLFGIAANLTKQHHRDVARRDEGRSRMTGRTAPAESQPEQRLVDTATSSPVAAALLELPERDREPLLLYAWEDLTYEEVGRSLDIPVGTVRSRIHRARHQVRERLERDAPDAATPRGGGAVGPDARDATTPRGGDDG